MLPRHTTTDGSQNSGPILVDWSGRGWRRKAKCCKTQILNVSSKAKPAEHCTHAVKFIILNVSIHVFHNNGLMASLSKICMRSKLDRPTCECILQP